MARTEILLEAGTNELELVEFYLDESRVSPQSGKEENYRGFYGVNVAKVLEIGRMPVLSELPDANSEAVLGAFNLRSQIVPLVDLGLCLGKKAAQSENAKIVVTEFNNVTTAFAVSGVTRIHRISWKQVEPPGNMNMVSRHSITGVVRIEDRIVFMLDLEKIVTSLNPSIGLQLDDDVDLGVEEKYHILIVDDSTIVRDMLAAQMRKAGFSVEALQNGEEAWNRLEQITHQAGMEGRHLTDYVQAMITDVEMPSVDGLNLCRRVKESPEMCDLPVVLFSSLISDRMRHKGQAVGADDQVSKPEVTELARRVHALITNRRG